MTRHSNVARNILVLRCWFPEEEVLLAKFDVSRAFRRKWLAVSAFGIIATKLRGHACLDQNEVFGHNVVAPPV